MYNFKMSSATGDNAPEAMDTKEPEVLYMLYGVVLLKCGIVRFVVVPLSSMLLQP